MFKFSQKLQIHKTSVSCSVFDNRTEKNVFGHESKDSHCVNDIDAAIGQAPFTSSDEFKFTIVR